MIEFDDVFVLYRGVAHDVVALRGLNLSVATGERVVVQGPSGSGKSTLIKVATSLVAPSAGRVTLMGRAVDSSTIGANRKGDERIGVVTQGTGRDLVPELTCLENVALQARLEGEMKSTANEHALSILKRFDLEHLADRYPGTLSNGEAQRIGLAAALSSEPSVIVADEPTGELDRVSADDVYDLLAEQIRVTGASLLLVTHDAQAARIADRTVTIRDGRVSSEHTGSRDLLIVDPRGWVRLPQHERNVSGIDDRAIAAADGHGLILHSPPTTTAVGRAESETGDKLGDLDRDQNPTASALDRPQNPTASALGRERGEVVVSAVAVTASVEHVVVLEPSSVTIRSGELTALVGRSGSGKTTLLSILAGLVQPTEGTVERIPKQSVAISTSVAGFAEQLTARQNLAIACEVRRVSDANSNTILDLLGIGHLSDRQMNTLSGGERQRVSVARALVTGADLVLLDEPTSQLDEASAAVVATALADLAKAGRTIVCTTHDQEIECRADNVITLGKPDVT